MASPNLDVLSEPSIRPSGKSKGSVTRWPIRVASLRALTELGLSDVKIAAYLKVSPERVASLRNLSRIAEG